MNDVLNSQKKTKLKITSFQPAKNKMQSKNKTNYHHSIGMNILKVGKKISDGKFSLTFQPQVGHGH